VPWMVTPWSAPTFSGSAGRQLSRRSSSSRRPKRKAGNESGGGDGDRVRKIARCRSAHAGLMPSYGSAAMPADCNPGRLVAGILAGRQFSQFPPYCRDFNQSDERKVLKCCIMTNERQGIALQAGWMQRVPLMQQCSTSHPINASMHPSLYSSARDALDRRADSQSAALPPALSSGYTVCLTTPMLTASGSRCSVL
jgi:hypothetical protein